jgi:hypothetical protein
MEARVLTEDLASKKQQSGILINSDDEIDETELKV